MSELQTYRANSNRKILKTMKGLFWTLNEYRVNAIQLSEEWRELQNDWLKIWLR